MSVPSCSMNVLIPVLFVTLAKSQKIADENEARRWFNEYSEKAQSVFAEVTSAEWNYATNITDYNEQVTINKTLVAAEFRRTASENASRYEWEKFHNPVLRRMFSIIGNTDTSAMSNQTKYQRLKELKMKMESVYHTGQVCFSSGTCMSMSPGLVRLFATSTEYDLLSEAWKVWRDVTGRVIKPMYTEFVQLSNEAIKERGELMKLHESEFELCGHTTETPPWGYNVQKMFLKAEEFFTSLGFDKLKPSFWEDSMFQKPENRKVSCSPSAWDFMNGRDFRIKMCTYVTMEDFTTVHHEMGHIYYFLQYSNLPLPFRNGANPGFHEALGDTIALSAQSLSHLHNIGLVDKEQGDQGQSEINFLMQMALQKIALLPYGLILDKWRWEVFSGETSTENYNERWWELRCKYQGLSPPVLRSSEDFDPGAKFHIPGNVPYIRYFVSYIIQFQFHKALCDAAGHVGPLHQCDIYRSVSSGNLLRNMMELGASRPWPDAMEKLTGQRDMDATALLDYFNPLANWLRKENEAYTENTGWRDTCESIASRASFEMIFGLITILHFLSRMTSRLFVMTL
ncbi:hypothetical protein ScPMuIL_011903 [Solemya velum]